MMRLSGWTLLICTMALWLCTTGAANADGTITVQASRDAGGGRIEVPVTNTVDTGDAPSTMQFDIQYDPLQVRPVEVVAGDAAAAAEIAISSAAEYTGPDHAPVRSFLTAATAATAATSGLRAGWIRTAAGLPWMATATGTITSEAARKALKVSSPTAGGQSMTA